MKNAVSHQVGRRGFFTRIGLTGSAVAAGLAGIGLFRFFYLKVFYERSSTVKIGRPDEFSKGTGRLFAKQRFFLFRDYEGFYAVSAICSHLGCVVKRVQEHYECPCHGSIFDENGQVVSGPAPSSLRWLKVTQSADGQLVVDVAKSVRTGTRFSHV